MNLARISHRQRLLIALLCLVLSVGLLLAMTSDKLSKRSATPKEKSKLEKSQPQLQAAATNASHAVEPVQSGGSYNIQRSVIAGGGDKSAGGNFTASGTIGQSTASSPSSGGAYTVGGGFWSGVGGGGCAMVVSPANASLPGGQLSVAYSQQFAQTGGAGNITWSISAGAPPANLLLDP
ncbi:MAG: hypothetical protein JNJ50_10950, partial [Acidobacteria bacterium]|nr:hypothetical protein [Acidobacteriota bacterium]